MAAGAGILHFACQSCAAVFEEAARRLAEGFLRRVAEELLRAAVPASDAALHVDHEDGVVPNMLDEQAKTLLGVSDHALRFFLFA